MSFLIDFSVHKHTPRYSTKAIHFLFFNGLLTSPINQKDRKSWKSLKTHIKFSTRLLIQNQ